MVNYLEHLYVYDNLNIETNIDGQIQKLVT
jgi:hypothetical protein